MFNLYIKKYTPKIIDCFIFYNELDLLTYRLNLLHDIVDYFIIVESTHTFTGKEKTLYFNENKQLFEKFQSKIIHIIVNDFPYKYPNINFSKNNQWVNEFFQRNAISRGLLQIHSLLRENDKIIIADLDEIPDPNTLKFIKYHLPDITLYSLKMYTYYYNLYTRFIDTPNLTKIISYGKYKELNIPIHTIRHMKCDFIEKGGWHLSYFGDVNFIQNKLNHFSHQEYNTDEFTNAEKIKENIKMSKNLFGTTNGETCRVPIAMNNYLPEKYNIYLRNYYESENDV